MMDVVTLLSITNTLVDTLKGIRDLVTSSDEQSTNCTDSDIQSASDAFSQFRDRLAVLVVRLEQSEELIHLLPVWNRDFDEINIWETELNDQNVVELDKRLRNIIRDSLIDHFSGLTHKESYLALDGIPDKIEKFKNDLEKLQISLNAIPYGNAEIWRSHWPTLKVRLGDLRDHASKIEMTAIEIHSDQIKEIRDATSAEF